MHGMCWDLGLSGRSHRSGWRTVGVGNLFLDSADGIAWVLLPLGALLSPCVFHTGSPWLLGWPSVDTAASGGPLLTLPCACRLSHSQWL